MLMLATLSSAKSSAYDELALLRPSLAGSLLVLGALFAGSSSKSGSALPEEAGELPLRPAFLARDAPEEDVEGLRLRAGAEAAEELALPFDSFRLAGEGVEDFELTLNSRTF